MNRIRRLTAVVISIALMITMSCVCFIDAGATAAGTIAITGDEGDNPVTINVIDPNTEKANDYVHGTTDESIQYNSTEVMELSGIYATNYTGEAADMYSVCVNGEGAYIARTGFIVNANETGASVDIRSNEAAFSFSAKVYSTQAVSNAIIRFIPDSIAADDEMGSYVENWAWQTATFSLAEGWNDVTYNFANLVDGTAPVENGIQYVSLMLSTGTDSGTLIAMSEMVITGSVHFDDRAPERTLTDDSYTLPINAETYNYIQAAGVGTHTINADGINITGNQTVGGNGWIALTDISFNESFDLSKYYTFSIDVYVPEIECVSGNERIRIQFGVSNTYTSTGIDSMSYNTYMSTLTPGEWNTITYSMLFPVEKASGYDVDWWSKVVSMRLSYQAVTNTGTYEGPVSLNFKNPVFHRDLFECATATQAGNGYTNANFLSKNYAYAISGNDAFKLESGTQQVPVFANTDVFAKLEPGDIISVWIYQSVASTSKEFYFELGSGANGTSSNSASTVRIFASSNQTRYIANTMNFTGWREFRFEIPEISNSTLGGSAGNDGATGRFNARGIYKTTSDSNITQDYLAYMLNTNGALVDVSSINYLRLIYNRSNTDSPVYYDGFKFVKKSGLTVDTSGVDTTVALGESFDFSALGVTLNYDDGTSADLDERTDARLAGYTLDTSKVNTGVAGEYPVTVTCESVSKTFNVTVEAGTVDPDKLVTVEQDNARLAYTGNWTTRTTAGKFSGNTAIRSYSTRSSVSFSFTGSYFNLVSYASSSQGSAIVSIDDKDFVVDMSADTATYQKSNEFFLAQGEHNVTVTGNGDGWFYIDKLVTDARLSPVIYKYEEEAFTFSEGWAQRGTWAFSGHSSMRSRTAGSTATISFEGVGFDLVGYSSPSYGTFDVYVDDEYVETVDTCREGYNYKELVYRSNAMTFGETHTVKIVVVSGAVIVDGIQIMK